MENIFILAGESPEVLSQIKTMGLMTGHNSLRNFIAMKDGKYQLNPDRTLLEMIIHIADDITHSTTFHEEELTSYCSFEKRAEL